MNNNIKYGRIVKRRLKEVIDDYDLDLLKIIKCLFPLKDNYCEVEIITVEELHNYLYLAINIYDQKNIVNYDIAINLTDLELSIYYSPTWMDIYKIVNNVPNIKESIFIGKKNGVKLIKKYTKKGNGYLRRNVGSLAYQTYQYIFEQNGFKAIIRFNLELDKTFQEEEFIERILNLEVIVSNLKELKSIICVLSSLGEIPNNEGFFEVLEVTPKKDKVKKKG